MFLASQKVIVTTPEKWDVITRKGGDAAAVALVRLLIIDEVRSLPLRFFYFPAVAFPPLPHPHLRLDLRALFA